MPSVERDGSISPAPKHKHSASDLGRSSVPMWDSSDPERAPPPLPLNPSSPHPSPTRHGTSETVAAAARALAERARQNAGPSPYTVNALPPRSPEKSPTRTPQHKRLQSLQQGDRRESKTPPAERDRNTDSNNIRALSPASAKDVFSSSPDRVSPVPDPPSSPSGTDILKDTTNLSRSPRAGPRPILGENSPPSATMLALQNMPHRDLDASLAYMANSSHTRSPHNIDSIHSQMLNLTTIATTLQKEMAALSRRSKDNATDLISLKEATKTRDEDIRKSLRELVSTTKATELNTSSLSAARSDMSRSTSAMDFANSRFLEPKPFHSPPFGKSVSLPKIPPIFGQDSGTEYDRASSPSPFAVDGAAPIAMLEKIIREMGTKEGQENLASTLSELLERLSKDNSAMAGKVEELLKSVRESQSSTALVKLDKSRRLSEESVARSPGRSMAAGAGTSSPIPRGSVISDELRAVLQKLKDSVTHGGGLTAEVKSQVRELRGEVLGMGRELGRKLDKVAEAEKYPQQDKSLVLAENNNSNPQLERIIREGLDELRQHMQQVIDASRHPSADSTRSRHSLDGSEVYTIVKQTLAEHAMERSDALELKQQSFDQDAIIGAVKEAYEAYKPEIELQQFGLERDEILQCLKEGLDDYRASRTENTSISREEVLDAVREGLQHFTPPAPVTEASEIKAEVLEAVRECLENFQPPPSQRSEWQPGDISRDEILGAVREGLGNFKKEGAREIEINRDDLFHAVKAGLDNTQTPFGGYGDEVLRSLHDIVEGMRVEFKEYSAANGRDTEMVLDTTKDGLESLRVAIESYVDRCRDVTGKDEIIQSLNSGLESIKSTVDRFVASNSREDSVSSRAQMVEYIKCEFEHLRDTMANSSATQKDELLDAIQGRDGSESIRSGERGFQSELSDNSVNMVREELQRLRESINGSVANGSASADKIDLLEAIRDGLDGLRNGNDRSVNGDETSDALEDIREELEKLRQSITSSVIPTESDHGTQGVLDAIQAGFEKLESSIGANLVNSGGSHSTPEEQLSAFQEGLRDLRAQISNMADRPVDVDMTVSYEILDTLKDSVAGIRDDIHRLKNGGPVNADGEVILSEGAQASSVLKKTDFDRIEAVLTRLQIKVEAMDQNMQATQPMHESSRDNGTTEGLANIDSTLREVQSTLNEISAQTTAASRQGVSKEDTEALEILLQNTKAKIDDQIIPCLDSLVTKDDLDGVEAVARLTSETVDGLTTKVEDSLASKDDVAAVFQLLQSAETTIKDLKEDFDKDSLEKPSKDDIDALENVCDEIKFKIDSLPTTDVAPTKEDVHELVILIQKFQKNHDKFKSQYESDLEITAKAFDDRKEESERIISQLTELKTSVTDSREDIKSRLKRSNEDVRALDEILQGIEDKITEAPNAVSDVQELQSIVSREFARSHDTMADLQSGSGMIMEKYDSIRSAILEDIGSKLDVRFAEVLDRHDRQQQIVEQAADAVAGKASQQDVLLTESRAMAEELKITVDTLGGQITGIGPALKEATEKMGDDAKTVYNRVEDMHSRMDANHADAMNETQLMRQDVSKSMSNVGVLHDALLSFQPQAMASLSNLLSMVAEHYEYSKRSSSDKDDSSQRSSIEETIKNSFASLPLPRIEASPAISREEDAKLHTKLDEVITAVKTDESKINQLIDQMNDFQPKVPGLDKIEEIQQQVQSTAAEISEFVALQTNLLSEKQESTEREAQEAAEKLNRCSKESADLEFKIENLKETRQSLAVDVESLMADRDSLTSQKSRLAAEVSSLETALKIRKEELHDMNARAEGLERRIIEGVMDHSRALLLSKQPRGPASMMNLKRVGSNVSAATASTTTPSTVASNGVNMALSRKRSTKKNAPTQTLGSRRILSLNQITSNVPNGSSVVSARPSLSNISSVKRSQSVKNPAIRTTSWIPHRSAEDFDKENESVREESDEEDQMNEDQISRSATSMTGRSFSQTHSQYSASDRRTSYGTGPSENSYMTGSYFSGSDTMRTTSVGSTIRSVVGGGSSVEEPVEETAEEEAMESVEETLGAVSPEPEQEEVQQEQQEGIEEVEESYDDEQTDTLGELGGDSVYGDGKELIIHPPDGYDSGLGSDLPTAVAMSQHGSDYFLPLAKHVGGDGS